MENKTTDSQKPENTKPPEEMAKVISYWRQAGIFDPAKFGKNPVTIIGAGGIGSPLALALSKLGIKTINIWDADTVSNHNIPNQFFRYSDIERPKVEALKELVGELTTDSEIVCNNKFYEDEPLEGIVISAVDNHEARKKIFNKVRMNLDVPLYIDGRIGGQVIKVFGFPPTDARSCQKYEKTLQEQTVELPCSERAVIDVSFFISAMITRIVRIFLANQELPEFVSILDARNLILLKDGNK